MTMAPNIRGSERASAALRLIPPLVVQELLWEPFRQVVVKPGVKTIVLLVLLTGAIAAAAQTNCTPMQALEKFKKFTLSDGTYSFRFCEDGGFQSGPLGMSGRTLHGTWKTTNGIRFTIIAEAGWINGWSRPGDYHRIIFHISDLRKQTSKPRQVGWSPVGPEDLFDGYW